MTNTKNRQPSLEQTSVLLRTLAAPLRLQILILLAKRGKTVVSEILAALRHRKATPSNLSGHLAVLSRARLVRAHREGRRVSYELDGQRAQEAVSTLENLLAITGAAAGRRGRPGRHGRA